MLHHAIHNDGYNSMYYHAKAKHIYYELHICDEKTLSKKPIYYTVVSYINNYRIYSSINSLSLTYKPTIYYGRNRIEDLTSSHPSRSGIRALHNF